MKNCPNCGALVGEDQTSCSICNTPINKVSNKGNSNTFFFFDHNNDKKEAAIYEPLPNNDVKKEKEKEVVNENDAKKNVMANILKEQEEKNRKKEKNDSFKAAVLSILIVAIIFVGGYYAVKLGFDNVDDGLDHIINSVVNQANSYTSVVKNYMKKYDYKYKSTNINGYYAKSKTFSFISVPLASKCVYADGKWSGGDSDEVSCEKFFSDINNNYCQAVPCDIPSATEIYIKETYEKVEVNGNEETITSGTILDGTTLTYDDIICSLSNNVYTCKYIEKQE